MSEEPYSLLFYYLDYIYQKYLNFNPQLPLLSFEVVSDKCIIIMYRYHVQLSRPVLDQLAKLELKWTGIPGLCMKTNIVGIH